MNQQSNRIVANCLLALAHPARVGIVKLLSERERTVTALSEALDIQQANASQHLAILRIAGLITGQRGEHGKLYALTSVKIVDLVGLAQEVCADWLEHEMECITGALPLSS